MPQIPIGLVPTIPLSRIKTVVWTMEFATPALRILRGSFQTNAISSFLPVCGGKIFRSERLYDLNSLCLSTQVSDVLLRDMILQTKRPFPISTTIPLSGGNIPGYPVLPAR